MTNAGPGWDAASEFVAGIWPGPDGGGPPDVEPALRVRPGLLPDEFWNARKIFLHIRRAAHSRACSGDVLFYTTLARMSGMISHHIRATTGIGGRASLNVFAATVGASGAGKSTGSALTRELMPSPHDPEDFYDGLPIGSGEGIAEAFMGVVEEKTDEVHARGPRKGEPVTVKVRKQVRHNLYCYVDEGQTLAQLGQRTGSTLAETIRRAAVGEALGQTNASEDRRRYVAPGSYSMGLLAGFQPSTAVPLLADASTGTPQRFLWSWAEDPSIPDEPQPWPGAITDHLGHWRPTGPVDLDFPDDVKRMLWRERVARNRGEVEVSELDGHAGLMKVKLAAMFALLDGRGNVTGDDWGLAEMAWKSSCAVRDALVARAKREAEVARELQEEAAVKLAVRTHDAKNAADLAVERVAQGLLRAAAKVPGGITYGALRKSIAGRERGLFEKALAVAVSRGWVVEENDRVCVRTDMISEGGHGGH